MEIQIWTPYLESIIHLIAWGLIPFVLLAKGTRTNTALSWILTLIFLPYLGVLLWWAIGSHRLLRSVKMKRQYDRLVGENFSKIKMKEFRVNPEQALIFPTSGNSNRFADHGFYPETDSNEVIGFNNSEDFFNQLEKQIQSARRSVHLLFYIWKDDEVGKRFLNLLKKKAIEGVKIRIILDSIGSWRTSKKFFYEESQNPGIEIVWFGPTRLFTPSLKINFRNHRKMAIIDNRVSFLGGINLGQEYLKWVDVGVQIEGPAVVQLQKVFCEDWFFSRGPNISFDQTFLPAQAWKVLESEKNTHCRIVASGPNLEIQSMYEAFLLSFSLAQTHVRIITPYFIPDQEILVGIRMAIIRGVKVEIILPRKLDHPLVRHASRSYFSDLCKMGVKIYEYRPSILHAKLMIIDEQLVSIGSTNLDIRSFRLNFEINCFLANQQLAKDYVHFFNQLKQSSDLITGESLENEMFVKRVFYAGMGLLSPIL